ncbi:MAG: stage III sporulation protein AA [Clostridia bacterium]|nr:stage III sporulation protein AA [Clostridia bacterium]
MNEKRLLTEILLQLPPRFRKILEDIDISKVQEIRFRAEKPLMIYEGREAYFLTEEGKKTILAGQAALVRKNDMEELLSSFCEHSVYAYLNEICDGFLTLGGGHRVGICGRCVLNKGEISNITDISGLNLRIAKEYVGCASEVFARLMNGEESVPNTVFIAPPQSGKTTFLRDFARLASKQFKVTIVDERSEIAAMKDGLAQFSVGLQTDVLDRFPKSKGMICAIRSLSPEVLITDELGSKDDLAAVRSVLNAGCRIVTSMHGDDPCDFIDEKNELYQLFDRAVILTRAGGIPKVAKVIEIQKKTQDGGCLC